MPSPSAVRPPVRRGASQRDADIPVHRRLGGLHLGCVALLRKNLRGLNSALGAPIPDTAEFAICKPRPSECLSVATAIDWCAEVPSRLAKEHGFTSEYVLIRPLVLVALHLDFRELSEIQTE